MIIIMLLSSLLLCSMFYDNTAPGGTLGAGFINVQFFNDNIFINNTGPALRVRTAFLFELEILLAMEI